MTLITCEIEIAHVFLYRETALAILSDTKQGLDALKCVESEKETTPLRLLIKEMPGEKCRKCLFCCTLYIRLLSI